jgi:hypothetical protein
MLSLREEMEWQTQGLSMKTIIIKTAAVIQGGWEGENKSCPPAKRCNERPRKSKRDKSKTLPAKRCNERPRKSKSEVNNEGISGTFGRNIPELRNIRKNIPDVRKEHSRTSGTSGNSRTSRMF